MKFLTSRMTATIKPVPTDSLSTLLPGAAPTAIGGYDTERRAGSMDAIPDTAGRFAAIVGLREGIQHTTDRLVARGHAACRLGATAVSYCLHARELDG